MPAGTTFSASGEKKTSNSCTFSEPYILTCHHFFYLHLSRNIEEFRVFPSIRCRESTTQVHRTSISRIYFLLSVIFLRNIQLTRVPSSPQSTCTVSCVDCTVHSACSVFCQYSTHGEQSPDVFSMASLSSYLFS